MYVTPTNIVPSLLVCLFVWRFVRRLRRNVGRQPVQRRRMAFSIIFFSLFTLGFAALSFGRTSLLLSLGGGVAGGAVLGLFGLHLTQFEETAEGQFYTPNMYLGVAVSLLLVARIVYRATLLYAFAQDTTHPPPAALRSPLTMFLFGLVAGYYIIYYTGVFIRTRKPIVT